MYYVYIIESEVDSSFYTGYTKDLQNRLKKHNDDRSGYTARKKPWKIVYAEEFIEKTEAIKRENFLKRQKNRFFYSSLIEFWSGSSVG